MSVIVTIEFPGCKPRNLARRGSVIRNGWTESGRTPGVKGPFITYL